MKTHQDTAATKKIWPSLVVFFVGFHSILLGLTIYFFTEMFYSIFFNSNIENFFFVRQSGIFLFLAGIFYLYPLVNLNNLHNLLLLVVFSKIIAVLFLISNAGHTNAPLMIYLAAFFDGLMALLIMGVYVYIIKNRGRTRGISTS